MLPATLSWISTLTGGREQIGLSLCFQTMMLPATGVTGSQQPASQAAASTTSMYSSRARPAPPFPPAAPPNGGCPLLRRRISPDCKRCRRSLSGVLQDYDEDGAYVKAWLPELAQVPQNKLHDPWTMSGEQQEAAGLIIGQDYPRPPKSQFSKDSRGTISLQSPVPVQACCPCILAWRSSARSTPATAAEWAFLALLAAESELL